ncbi:hypothetical protein JCM8097_008088 [Rhodosporidiobolus ruineniae]
MATNLPVLPANASVKLVDEDLVKDGQVLPAEKAAPTDFATSTSPISWWHLLWRSGRHAEQLDSTATQESVFDQPGAINTISPGWEGLPYLDPALRWTWREEHAVTRILDLRVTAFMCLCFFALHIDTSNINSAVSANILPNLGLNTNDYNLGNTLFAVGFLLAEFPSQLVAKKVGADRWIPTLICAWSVVAACQFWLSGKKSFLATRFLLGFMQGGFLPECVLYFSYFYTKAELPLRLGLFWATAKMCSIVTSFLAVGLLKIHIGHGGQSWRALFLIEGCRSFVIGLFGFLVLVPGPAQTKTRINPKGWFTERQAGIIINKIIRDDPTKGDMHNREGITFRAFFSALGDWDLLPLYSIGFLLAIPAQPAGSYLTQTLHSTLGFSTTHTNLLTIPPNVVGFINTVFLAWLSEAVNSRWFAVSYINLWCLPFLVTLLIKPVTHFASGWTAYAMFLLLNSSPSSVPLVVSWISRNSGSVRTRTVSASMYNVILHLQSIASANIYREDDKPEYRRGNRQLVIICVVAILQAPLCALYYRVRNRIKAKQFAALSEEEQEAYSSTTTTVGAKRLDFTFAY